MKDAIPEKLKLSPLFAGGKGWPQHLAPWNVPHEKKERKKGKAPKRNTYHGAHQGKRSDEFVVIYICEVRGGVGWDLEGVRLEFS